MITMGRSVRVGFFVALLAICCLQVSFFKSIFKSNQLHFGALETIKSTEKFQISTKELLDFFRRVASEFGGDDNGFLKTFMC